jgi:aminopeptidase N
VKAGKRKLALKLEQKRFLFDGSPDRERFVWKVPVAAVSASMNRPKTLLLDKRSASLELQGSPDDWIKLNPGQSGFFRAAYPAEYAARLGKAIELGQMPAIDALGIVDDAFALARAGVIRTSSTLAVVRGCSGQDDYNVWLTAAGILGAIENILPEDAERKFARLALSLVAPAAKRSGWSAKPGDGHLDVLRRPLLIGRMGHYGDDATIREAASRFEAFGNGEALDPNLRSAVYAIVAEKLGTAAVLEKFLTLYRTSPLQEEKVRLLRALTRFRDKTLVERALAFALSPEVRSQDTYVVLAGFGGNKAARPLNWTFVKKNWPALTERFSGGNVGLLSHIIEGAASGFTDEASARDVDKFLKAHRIPGTERAVRQTLEVIRSNRAWKRRDEKEILKWLEGR